MAREEMTSIYMTREEIIDTLKGLVFGTFDRTTVKEREALDMAIKALEQETCEDCISRQAVIDEIEFYQINPQHFDFVSLIGDIKDLPSVTPTQKWIPVSWRLPEVTETITDADFDGWYTVYESSEVLVFGTCEGGREKRIHTANYNEWIHEDGRKECEWRDNLSGDIEINVIAWMPLPEPYMAEARDKE